MKDAAATVGVSARTIHRWIQNRELPVYRMGAVVRVRVDELQSLLERPSGPDDVCVSEQEIARAILDRGAAYKGMLRRLQRSKASPRRKS